GAASHSQPGSILHRSVSFAGHAAEARESDLGVAPNRPGLRRELRNAGRRPIEFGTRARDRGLALLRRGAHGARSPYRGVSLTFHEVNMRSPFCEVAVLLLAGGLAAQDPGANAAREEYAALMADLKAAQ